MLITVQLALAVAAALAATGLWWRQRALATLALIWLGYAGYEWLMLRRVLCSGECNIRVDLLLIAPALLLATAVTLGRCAWRQWRRRSAPLPDRNPDEPPSHPGG